jgi:hypothetical protein
MAVFLGAFAYFLATQIVIPMRDDQKAFMQSVIKTNETHASAAATQSMAASQSASAISQLTQIQQTQSSTLSTLADQQRQTTTILQQIRDDQRNGAWRDKPSHQ